MAEQPESQIVVGVMSPMTAANMRIGGRSAARAGGRAVIDLKCAADLGTVTPNIVCGNGITPQLTTATAITED